MSVGARDGLHDGTHDGTHDGIGEDLRDAGLRLPLHGLRLIEASAGTGKTFTLTTLLLRLLLERGLPLPQILAVTFTRAATQELRQRLRRRLQLAQRLLDGDAAALRDAAQGAGEVAITAAVLATARDAVGAERVRLRLRAAVLQLDEATIATIHGFCQRALREFGFRAGALAEVALVDDAGDVWDEIAAQLWRAAAADAWPQPWSGSTLQQAPQQAPQPAQAHEVSISASDVHALIAQLWDTPAQMAAALPALCDPARVLYPAREASIEAAALHALRDVAQAWFDAAMAARAQRSQDQLIEIVWRASAEIDFARALARRWPALLIDEFQDTDPRQWDIFRRIHVAGEASDEHTDAANAEREDAPLLCLIGDPKQAIYRFRGGDPATYVQARTQVQARAHADAVVALDANYRSTPSLLRALDVLFAANALPFVDDAIGYRPLRAAGAAGDEDLRIDGAPSPALTLHWLPAPPHDPNAGSRTDAARGLRGKDAELQLMCDAAVAAIARLLARGRLREAGDRRGDDFESDTLEGDALGSDAREGAALDGAAFGDDDPDDTRTRPLRAAEIAVLAQTNEQAAMMQRALARAGIAAALRSKRSVFAGDAARMLRTLLHALAEPGDLGRFRAALATPLLGYDAAAIAALDRDPVTFAHAADAFERAAQHWRSRGPLPALLPFVTAAAQRWLREPDGARMLTDALHLAELLQAEAPQHHGPAEQLAWFVRQSAAGEPDETRQLRLEADADLVQIATVHASKGLEYAVVVLPFLAWQQEPRKGGVQRVEFRDRGGHPARAWFAKPLPEPQDRDAIREQAEREARAEAQRLLYVALTRARYAVHAVWSRSKSVEATALHWLLHGGAPGEGKKAGKKSGSDHAAMQARIERLAAESAGDIVVRAFDPLAAAVADDVARIGELRTRTASTPPARSAQRRFGPELRLHSFSALHARSEADAVESEDDSAARGAADEGLAVDDDVRAGEALAGTAFGNAVHRVLETADFALWALPAARTLATIAARPVAKASGGDTQLDLFAAGNESTPGDERAAETSVPGAHTLEHEGIEDDNIDDDSIDDADAQPWPADQRALLERALLREGLSATPAHLAQTAGLVRRALNARLPGGVRLCALPATQCVREMGFHFRLRPTRLDALYRLLDAHGYPRPRRPPQATLEGFMQGYIDLVYRDASGRHYVLDYKTNRLPGYDRDSLRRAVQRQDYDLQYLIYLVALRRWLRLRRGARFDSAHDIGGAAYLFLRGIVLRPSGSQIDDRTHDDGMHDESMHEEGIHFDAVSPTLLAELDALFDGEMPAAAGAGGVGR